MPRSGYLGALHSMIGAVASLALALALAPAAPAALADGLPGATVVPATPSWSGVYVGLHAGVVRGDTDWRFPFNEYYNAAAGEGFSTHPTGMQIGSHVGANRQQGRVVAGIELSYDGAAIKQARIGPVTPLFSQDRLDTKLTDLVLATGRLGYAFSDAWMLYAKGGYANGKVRLSAYSGLPGPDVSADKSRRESGWTGGVGLEYRLLPNAVLGLEYDYVTLRGSRFTTATGGAVVGDPFNVDLDDLHVHTLMARISIPLGQARAQPLK